MNAPLVIDREAALSNVGGDPELLREIAGLFLDAYRDWMAEIRNAANQGDSQALKNAAHGLKGSVANFGADSVVVAAQKVEALGRAHLSADPAEVAKALDTLDLALAALRPELEAL